MKKIGLFFLLSAFFLIDAYAEDLSIVFTGETRSALYPCHCPIERDGGLARRYTKIKELRKKSPNLLFLDTGNIFAGGPLDYSQQNTEFDKKRTLINIAAIKLMRYDAVAVGLDEFNFGIDFFKEQLATSGIPFVSCNIKLQGVMPYIIKEAGGVRIAVIGLTAPQAKDRTPNLEMLDSRQALKDALAEIKNKGADLIILLTNFLLGEEEALIKEFPEINILIVDGMQREQMRDKIGSTIVAYPVREGRRLGRIELSLKDKKITGYKIDEMRVSDEIKDDPEILALVPQCFSNRDCITKPGSVAYCNNPGEPTSQCVSSEAPKIYLTVIKPKICITCNVQGQLEMLRSYWGNNLLEVKYLDYESKQGKQLAKELGITLLPAFILNKDVEKEKSFSGMRDKVVQKGAYYLIKPEAIGVSYLADRNRTAGSFDLFISLFDKNAAELLDLVRPYKPNIHLLVVEDEQNKTFSCQQGRQELEEDLRAVCVMKNYPQMAIDYLACRAKNAESSWWDDCAKDMDLNKIKACAKSRAAEDLLRE
ncbi:MAG: hypothetical protein NC914_03610, partial [Candidatus Omnitrophica bacterium]|nr:hypothetical protein [Candidatus Omnitrophota bacterium]